MTKIDGSKIIGNLPAISNANQTGRPANNTQIGNLLNRIAQNSSNSQGNANIVSQKEYEYGHFKGTLITYDDGTCVFKDSVISRELYFSDEKCLEKQMPYQQVANPEDPKKRVTINYKYHNNGKLSYQETINPKGVIINKSQYDRQGKIKERIVYNKNGEINSISKYKHNKDNSVVINRYDKNNKLLDITTEQYNGNKRVSSETRDVNNNLIEERKFDALGRPQTGKQYYPDGKIKVETEYWDNGVIKEQSQYDSNGNITGRISAEIDGNFGVSRQVSEGDCYLMATINSIRNLSNGQEMLKDLVKITTDKNGEKVYTVTFPGAQVAAEGLKKDSRINPEKMHITGTYSFTESEMQGILKQAGKRYSIGDGDVILLEAAFEKYRKEVEATLKDNGMNPINIGEAGLITGIQSNNILAGGRNEDAIFILTGRTSEHFEDKKTPYALDFESLKQNEIKIEKKPSAKINPNQQAKAISEVESITADRKKLNVMLDKIMNDQNDGQTNLIATAGFLLVKHDGRLSAHALTIKSVSKDTVTLINPWLPNGDPNKELTMSREEFLKSVKDLTLTDTNKKPVTVDDVQNGTAPLTPQTPNKPPVNQHTQQTQQTQHTNTQTPTKEPYPVRRGDNLWKIAKRILGAGANNSKIANYVEKIIKANPSLKSNPNLIVPGQKLVLP